MGYNAPGTKIDSIPSPKVMNCFSGDGNVNPSSSPGPKFIQMHRGPTIASTRSALAKAVKYVCECV